MFKSAKSHMYTDHCSDSDTYVHYYGNCRGQGCDRDARRDDCLFYL